MILPCRENGKSAGGFRNKNKIMLSDKQMLWKTSLLWMLWPALDTGASLVAQLVKNPPAMRETLVRFLGQKFPLEKRYATHSRILGLPWWAQKVKESECNAGDLGSIPGLGSAPGGGQGNPLHCSCLENLMDRRAWWAIVYGVTKSWTWLSD